MSTPQRQFYVSAYFITNAFLILLYPMLRQWTKAGKRDLKHEDSFGFTYQNSLIYTGIILIMLNYVRATSLKGFFLDMMTVIKIIITGLLYMAKYDYCFYYILLCAIFWIFVPYPKYNGPHKFISITSQEQLDTLIKGQNLAMKNEQMYGCQYLNKHMCFIEFYSNGVTQCIVAKELWYSYSMKYTTQSLIFLQVNVDRHPKIAKRFSINTSGFSKQLPTVLILENGEQTIRFPTIKKGQKVDRVAKLDYKILLTYFDLESRYLQTRENHHQKNKNI